MRVTASQGNSSLEVAHEREMEGEGNASLFCSGSYYRLIYSMDEPRAKQDKQQSQPMTKSLESHQRRRAKQAWEIATESGSGMIGNSGAQAEVGGR